MSTPFHIHPLLDRLLDRRNLSVAEAESLLRALTDESLPPAIGGAVLAALRAKGETAEELRGFALAMRALARRVPVAVRLGAADVVGTGGDASGSLNISTGVALLAAACGVPIVKHGNRSMSSQSGSADVLEELGVPLAADPEQALACLAACGFAFLFAPNFHPAMRAIGPVRRALRVRTVFNILGPLTNPATPPFSLIGAFDLATAELMAGALSGMDISRAFVVHGEPGWDEATPVGPFTLFDVRPGSVQREERDPRNYGIPRCSPDQLRGAEPIANARALEAVLDGRDEGPHRDALVLGGGLALEVSGRVGDLSAGIAQARAALESGAAAATLEKLRSFRVTPA
jgi:anthranilate phosphoribosyltransferase